MKHGTFAKYEASNLDLPQRALLTAWDCLAAYRDDLVLKLNAFGGPAGRKTPKDAHDILYLATEYVGGSAAAVQAFHTERKARNRAVLHAVSALQRYFENENAEGPMACAAFRLNNLHEEREFEEESILIRQQCVTLAHALLHERMA